MAARRTGLSPHVIRVWERRYQAVTPCRSGNNRRLYSDCEIARLLLLQRATQSGHSISRVANLGDDEIRALLQQDRDAAPHRPSTNAAGGPSGPYVSEAVAAVQRLDGQALDRLLGQASAELGQLGLLQHLIVPLIREIGEGWQQGRIKVAHEHLACAVLRTFLGHCTRTQTLPECAPRLIVTTPPGQTHELGALLVAVAAGNHGWRVAYLGTGVPAEEIAGAARQFKARAVALSLVYPEDDPYLETELVRLQELLPSEVALLVGGRAAAAYRNVLERVGAIEVDHLTALPSRLDEIRRAAHAKPAIPATRPASLPMAASHSLPTDPGGARA